MLAHEAALANPQTHAKVCQQKHQCVNCKQMRCLAVLCTAHEFRTKDWLGGADANTKHHTGLLGCMQHAALPIGIYICFPSLAPCLLLHVFVHLRLSLNAFICGLM